MELWQLRQMQGLPLEIKVEKTKQRVQEWCEHWQGDVYISFSGGKDSTVLLHIVRSIYPNIKAVYCDTGLEFPEIKSFVKTVDNIVPIKPKIKFQDVIKDYGYPIISKEIALTIDYARKGSKWAISKLNGEREWGNHKKYKYLLDAPFKISDKCCYKMKKEPFHIFESETKLKPFIGTMASEGGQRETAYKRTGCNSFESKKPKSVPLGFWMEQDIWDYIKTFNVPYSKIYDMGYNRTGCMFCAFGCNLEQEPNRFQKMALTHPNQYKYCMNNLGMKEVLDYIEVPYMPNIRTFKDDRNHKYQQFKMSV